MRITYRATLQLYNELPVREAIVKINKACRWLTSFTNHSLDAENNVIHSAIIAV